MKRGTPVDPFSARLGRRIKELRRERRWSQGLLAERAELNPHYVSDLERGSLTPLWSTVCKLASALEVTPALLFPDDIFYDVQK